MIELGRKVRDRITGFEGVVTGRATYLYGCDQYVIVPAVDKDGKMGEGAWVDEGRIEVIGVGVSPESVRVEKNGGPNDLAPRVR